jgi:hypothetical protein
MLVRISIDEVRKLMEIEKADFPKYTAPLINLANQYAQGTRPKVVGQMSELIQQFSGKTLSEWEEWYLKQKPDAIKNATDKILQMLKNLRNSIDRIDEKMVEDWVRDLVIVKTFLGLRFHEAILRKGAEIKRTTFRLSESSEESKGVDGYIGEIPVSIKPSTYESKASLPESIQVKMIYYRKVDDAMEVDFGDIL